MKFDRNQFPTLPQKIYPLDDRIMGKCMYLTDVQKKEEKASQSNS